MAHAAHFLERVGRLGADQADLALTLYRDNELVRRVLRAAAIPDGAPRVAFALEDDPSPPHLIVERDGAFVTCLGPGMAVKDAHVVPRAQLRAVCEGVTEVRARMQRAGAADVESAFERLGTKLIENGSRVSREDANAALAIAPLVTKALLPVVRSAGDDLYLSRERILAGKGGEKFARSREGMELLRFHWQTEWLMAHFAVIAAAGHVDRQRRKEYASMLEQLLYLLWSFGEAGPIARAVWAVAQFGGLIVDDLIAAWRTARRTHHLFAAPLALVTIARGVPGFGSAAAAALRTLPDTRGAPVDWAGIVEDVGEVWRKAMRDALNGPALSEEQLREVMASLASEAFGVEVPPDVARAALASIEGHPLAERSAGLVLAPLWLSFAAADELYLPAAQLARFDPAWDAERAARLWRRLTRDHAAGTPVHAEPRVGRNDPCPCGSGRKSKKCCAA